MSTAPKLPVTARTAGFDPRDFRDVREQPERITGKSAWIEHIPFAFALTEMLEPRLFVELGAHAGDSYCAFCQAVDTIGLPTRCYAVDTWEGDYHSGLYDATIHDELSAYHDARYGRFSTLLRTTFDEAVLQFDDASIDLLHIDGLHTYEAVKHDFETWRPKMSERGVVLFHDTRVRKRDFGVWKLWQELSSEYPSYEFDFCFGLGVLAVGSTIPEPLERLFACGAEQPSLLSAYFQVAYDDSAKSGELQSHTAHIEELRAHGAILQTHLEATQAHAAGVEAQRAQTAERLAASEQQLTETSERLAASDQQFAETSEQLAASEEQLTETSERLSTSREQLTETAERLAASEQELASTSAQLSDRNKTIRETTAHLNVVETQLACTQDQLAHNSARLEEIYASTIWKFTNPLRRYGKARNDVRFVAGALRRVLRSYGARRTCRHAWTTYRTEGWTGLRNHLISASTNRTVQYEEWVKQWDQLTAADRLAIRRHVHNLEDQPLISVVMPVYNTPRKWLKLSIESVLSQLYKNWELCIADDASTQSHVKRLLESYRKKDPRIKVVYREQNGHISAASNSALKIARGEFVAFLDHDDELAEHALYMAALVINAQPDAALIYSDEDKINERGKRHDPYFKPDWNPDLLTSQNYICHLTFVRRSLVREIGGFREGYEGSQDWDLVLRASEGARPEQIHHIPHVLYHWRSIPGSTARTVSEKDYAVDAGTRAVQTHFERTGIDAQVSVLDTGHLRVHRQLPDPAPKVSIIIPTRNGGKILRRCIESVRAKTDHTNYEILLVDNQSDDATTIDYLKGVASDPTIRVIQFNRPFNFSAINNEAVRLATGELVALLNDDTEIISPDWLREMTSHALRPEIGAVGAKLYYPDNTIQHDGVTLGVGGVACHIYKHEPRFHLGQKGRARVTQTLSAVTAACMVMRRRVFLEVGGLNDVDLAIAFNDTDLCLRVQAHGYRVLWTPFAELYHHESVSRGYEDTPEKQARFAKEATYMRDTWADHLDNDPHYNINLSLEHAPFQALATPPRTMRPWLSEVRHDG